MAKKDKMKKKEAESEDVVVENCTEKEKGTLAKFLPSTITITGFCFGLTAIRFALFQRWEYAVMCIFIAALLDAFDGRVARAIGQSSALGAELDSLSDLVCFGVAPAVVLFLRSMYLFEGVGWAVCMFFTVCCAIRLARFNAAIWCGEPQDDIEKRFFTGVPAPAGAMIALLPMTMFFETSKMMFLKPGFIAICLVFSGVLMLSTIKTFSTKMVQIDNGSIVQALLAIALCVICLITNVWLSLSLFTIAYAVAIPLGVFEYHKYYKGRQKKDDLEGVIEDKATEELQKLEYKAESEVENLENELKEDIKNFDEPNVEKEGNPDGSKKKQTDTKTNEHRKK